MHIIGLALLALIVIVLWVRGNILGRIGVFLVCAAAVSLVAFVTEGVWQAVYIIAGYPLAWLISSIPAAMARRTVPFFSRDAEYTIIRPGEP